MNWNSLMLLVAAFSITGAAADESAGWGEREHLFGEAGGARTALEARGLYTELTYTGEYFHNFEGGLDEGGKYRGDLSLTLTLRMEEMGWWSGGTFFLHVQNQHGNGITEEHTGDFQVLSNIDADDYTQISELWYRHEFAEGGGFVKFGKQEANADFAFVEFGGEFLNSSAGFSPTIPLVTFPDQDWGLVVGISPADWFSVDFGVYHGEPDGGRSVGNTIDNLRGPMVMVEPAVHYRAFGLSGHLRLGVWWNGAEAEKLDPARGDQDHTAGIYATWDQEVFREDPNDLENVQGIGLFAQLGYSDEDVLEAEAYAGGGVQWTGAIRARDDDVLGLGVFHVEFSEDAGLSDASETAIELYYRVQALPWLSIKPDVQWIRNPGGSGLRNAWAAGLRTEFVF